MIMLLAAVGGKSAEKTKKPCPVRTRARRVHGFRLFLVECVHLLLGIAVYGQENLVDVGE